MNIETLRELVVNLPAVTEEVKWDNDLCFLIGGKMFCVASLTPPLKVSFKATEEDFNKLIDSEGIIPAPYMARNKWVQVINVNSISLKEWQFYINQSYNLIKAKLTKKVKMELGINY